MDALEGIWRLVDSRAWDELGNSLAAPYGEQPIGTLAFRNGRLLAVLCGGNTGLSASLDRGFSSYGGTYRFDGKTLEVTVDMASDPRRVGGSQTRGVVVFGERMILRPPLRAYGDAKQQRELLWERVWRPAEDEAARTRDARDVVGWDAASAN